MSDWQNIDHQMYRWETKLRDDLRLSLFQARALATCLNEEVQSLAETQKIRLRYSGHINIDYRIEELKAFQEWTEIASNTRHPAITRAQVITQNYICFVYLRESWFKLLQQELSPNTATFICCEFLLSESLHRFRNAFAHGNWRYLDDFSGLQYWARTKDSGPQEISSIVLQHDLDFWQMLSRCTAYSSMVAVI